MNILGYGLLGEKIHETEKAALFRYHRWEVWIPKKLLLYEGSGVYAPTYALNSAKARFDEQP